MDTNPPNPYADGRPRRWHAGAAAAVLWLLAPLVAPTAMAQGVAVPRPTDAAPADALARCERAVREALVPAARTAAELRFTGAPTLQRSASGEGGALLQGEGQWRDGGTMRSFKFSCNLDVQSGEALGVVIRQAATAAPAPPVAVEPDLSHLSPAACESGAAQALKQRWPRVSQISFDAATRSLTQLSASRAELHGQGRAQPSPDSPQRVHFGFDCSVDPRDGRVLEVRLSG